MHTGMSVLDAALNLSLDSLEDCTGQETSLATPYMLREMYISLCVLQKPTESACFGTLPDVEQ